MCFISLTINIVFFSTLIFIMPTPHILISAFSFFEAYVKNVIKELIEFHGGKEEMIRVCHKLVAIRF